jgi:iron complex outermembrane receptor protein
LALITATAAAAQAANPADANASSVGEVIVTAQHRAERAHDVPISVVAKTATQLEQAGVKNLGDLGTVVSGVKIDSGATFVVEEIRGVSSALQGAGTESPVAIYLDGVYQPNQLANHFDFADLDHIEVDKGPQGTNYGRNATAGAIAIFTKQPSFTPHGDFEIGYGNYNDYLAKAFITGPLVDGLLAGSLSAYYERRDDYNYDVARDLRPFGLESRNIRAKLLFTPTSWASFNLALGYSDRYDTGTGDTNPVNGNTVAAQDPAAIFTSSPYKIAINWPGFAHVKAYTATLTSKFELDYGTLTSISGSQYSWNLSATDGDRAYEPNAGPGYSVYQTDHTYSEDLTFASRKFGPFKFVAGASYFYDNNAFAPVLVYSGSTLTYKSYSPNPALSYAGFFEGNYDITDRLNLIAGVRYTWERRSSSQVNSLVIGGHSVLYQQGTGPTLTATAVTPRVSLRYKIDEGTNVYFTYSEGFKSGGVSVKAVTDAPLTHVLVQGVTYQPEYIKSYEVGLKSAITPRLTVNAAGFYYDYTNLQVESFPSPTVQIIQNAATARIYGVDADATARVTDELTFTAGVTWTHAYFVSYPNAAVLIPAPLVGGKPDGNIQVSENASGKEMIRSPEVTLTLTADYVKRFEPGKLDLSGTVYYTGKFYFDPINRLGQSPYATLNLDASWQPTGSNFKFEAWGRNVTGTIYRDQVLEDGAADGQYFGAPATYGLAIHYAF